MSIPLGDCYRFASQQAHRYFHEGTLTVVHGICTDKWNGQTYHHAWVERDGRCFDWQSKYAQPDGIPLDVFYDTYQPHNLTRYTPEEAGAKMCRSGHYGPWDVTVEELVAQGVSVG